MLGDYLAVAVVIFRFEPHITAGSSVPEPKNFTAITVAETKTNAPIQLIVSQYFFIISHHLFYLEGSLSSF